MSSSPDKNEVEVYCNDITAMTWSGENFLSVTSGESHSGNPTAQKDTNSWTVTFLCDREGSNGVANTFNGWCGGNGHEYCPTSGDSEPEELNFAFAMDCVFLVDGNSYNTRLCFGQGSKGLSNNWWFGSKAIVGAKELVVYGSNMQKVAAYALSGDTSDLVLTRI
jgi:hypothetical protein